MPRKEISPGIWMDVPDVDDSNTEVKDAEEPTNDGKLIAPTSEEVSSSDPEVSSSDPEVKPPSFGGMDGKICLLYTSPSPRD